MTVYSTASSSRTQNTFYCAPLTPEQWIENLIYRNNGNDFLEYANNFLKSGCNPNLTFSSIEIENNEGHSLSINNMKIINPSFFQLVCVVREKAKFYRERDLQPWNTTLDDQFEELIDRMLEDKRLDVTRKFSMQTQNKDGIFFIDSIQKCCWEDSIEVDGLDDEDINLDYGLQDLTIVHYLTMTGRNIPTLRKILEIAPDLIHSGCSITRLRGSINDCVTDTVSDWNVFLSSVTPLHFAAKLGDGSTSAYFFGNKVNPMVLDSKNRSPMRLLQISIDEGDVKKNGDSDDLLKLLNPIIRLPKSSLPVTNILLRKNGYTNVYDLRTKNPIYTYERLTPDSLKNNSSRKSCSFKVDFDVPKLNRSKHADYAGSGLQRGHLAAAANAGNSQQAMEDTFLLTNVSPQDSKLNQGYWKILETKIRKLQPSHDLIEVYSGPLYQSKNHSNGITGVFYRTLGNGNVAVPTHFFKVIHLYKGLIKKSFAFILPNAPIDKTTPLKNFIATIDKVQELSGICFNQL